MHWALPVLCLLGCLVYADSVLNSCSQECLDFIQTVHSGASSIIRTRSAGVWRVRITMRPLRAYTDMWTTIQFPPHNQSYINNMEIRWPILAFPGNIVMFEVVYINIQNSVGCYADKFQICNGYDFYSDSDRIDTFCGTSLGARFYNSTSSDTSIRLVANGDYILGTGFIIRYRALTLPVTTTTTTTTSTTTTPQTSHTTLGVAHETTTMTTTTTEATTTTDLKTTTEVTTKTSTSAYPTTDKTSTSAYPTTDKTSTSAYPTTDKTSTSAYPTTSTMQTSTMFNDDEDNEVDIIDVDSVESSVLTDAALHLSIPFCFHHYTNQHILTATSESQVFKSRGYPLSYPSNLQEEWLIVKPNANHTLSIEVVDGDTEYSINCAYDRVTIYDRSCPDSSPVRIFCGTAKPYMKLTGDRFALIRFYADTTNHGRGIMVKYWLEDNGDAAADESGLDASSLKSIIIGIVAAIGGFCVSLGVIRWVMRCQERRRRKAGAVRRRRSTVSQSDNPPARSSRRHGQRLPANDDNPTINVVTVSQGRQDGSGGRNPSTDFTGIVVRPPSYNALFKSVHTRSELVLHPPAYDAKSYEPPPYPGSPVPPPSVEAPPRSNRLLPSVHGSRGGNRRNQRRTQNTTRIVVKPQDAERHDVRSPPPRYEE